MLLEWCCRKNEYYYSLYPTSSSFGFSILKRPLALGHYGSENYDLISMHSLIIFVMNITDTIRTPQSGPKMAVIGDE